MSNYTALSLLLQLSTAPNSFLPSQDYPPIPYEQGAVAILYIERVLKKCKVVSVAPWASVSTVSRLPVQDEIAAWWNSCAGRRAAGLVALGPPQGGNRHTAGQEAARRMWTPPHWQPRSLSRLRKVVTASPAGKRHATRARSAPLGKYFVWI